MIFKVHFNLRLEDLLNLMRGRNENLRQHSLLQALTWAETYGEALIDPAGKHWRADLGKLNTFNVPEFVEAMKVADFSHVSYGRHSIANSEEGRYRYWGPSTHNNPNRVCLSSIDPEPGEYPKELTRNLFVREKTNISPGIVSLMNAELQRAAKLTNDEIDWVELITKLDSLLEQEVAPGEENGF